MAEFPHPDQIQYGVKQAEQGKRYQFYAGACYLLHAKSAAMQGAAGLTVKFFTSEDPDNLLADELKAVLAAPDERDKDAPDIYFPHGIYIEVDGVTSNTDVALVEANWVPREAYCRAYPDQTRELIECWSKAAGRDAERWLENFDPGDPDDGEWANEGAAGTGGSAGGFLALDGSTEMTGDIVMDEQADHSSTPAAGKGYLWTKSTTPSTLIFTDDAGTDTTLGSGGASDYVDTTTYKVTVGTSTLSGVAVPTHHPHTSSTLTSLHWCCTKSIAASGSDYLTITAKNEPDGTTMQSTVYDTQSGYTANTWVDLGIDQNNSFDGTGDSIEVTHTQTGTVTSLNGHNLLFRAVYS